MGIATFTDVDELYEASIRTMLELVQQQPSSFSSLLLVGHNPAISYLAEYLIGDRVMGMEPGGVFRLTFEIEEWSQLEKGLATAHQFQSPRDVP
jgi:phosphohistidine phosphatase